MRFWKRRMTCLGIDDQLDGQNSTSLGDPQRASKNPEKKRVTLRKGQKKWFQIHFKGWLFLFGDLFVFFSLKKTTASTTPFTVHHLNLLGVPDPGVRTVSAPSKADQALVMLVSIHLWRPWSWCVSCSKNRKKMWRMSKKCWDWSEVVSVHHDIHIGLRTSKNSSKISTLWIVTIDLENTQAKT